MMNGHILPRTPVAVDFWKIRQCPQVKVFFLSHCHADHMAGLSSTWQRPIHCSEITAQILQHIFHIQEEYIRPLEFNRGYLITLDNEGLEMMTVTLIDANHCPGAAMFLFEGYFGTVLYTADFRFHGDMFVETPLSHKRAVDVLYLDNTYCNLSCEFPTREKCEEDIIDIIRCCSKDADVVIGIRNLGKEDLLVKIAQTFHEWISVSTNMYENSKILDLPNVFTTDLSICRMRTEPLHLISNKRIQQWNQRRRTVVILPTAIYNGIEASPFVSQKDVHVVPYSDHSSYLELHEFVSQIKPRTVIPIVCASTRGPFRCSLESRADMSCFTSYLDTGPRPEFEIPETVKQFMSRQVTPTSCLSTNKIHRRQFLNRKKSKGCVMGVIFDTSPEKNSDAHRVGASVDENKRDRYHNQGEQWGTVTNMSVIGELNRSGESNASGTRDQHNPAADYQTLHGTVTDKSVVRELTHSIESTNIGMRDQHNPAADYQTLHGTVTDKSVVRELTHSIESTNIGMRDQHNPAADYQTLHGTVTDKSVVRELTHSIESTNIGMRDQHNPAADYQTLHGTVTDKSVVRELTHSIESTNIGMRVQHNPAADYQTLHGTVTDKSVIRELTHSIESTNIGMRDQHNPAADYQTLHGTVTDKSVVRELTHSIESTNIGMRDQHNPAADYQTLHGTVTDKSVVRELTHSSESGMNENSVKPKKRPDLDGNPTIKHSCPDGVFQEWDRESCIQSYTIDQNSVHSDGGGSKTGITGSREAEVKPVIPLDGQAESNSVNSMIPVNGWTQSGPEDRVGRATESKSMHPSKIVVEETVLGCGRTEPVNIGTREPDAVDDVSTGTREPDVVDDVSTGTREPDDVDHVSTGTREPDVVDDVSTGTREPDVVDDVSTGTREPDVVDDVSTGTREPDVVDDVSTGTREPDVVDDVSTGTRKPDVVDDVSTGTREPDVVDDVSTGTREPDVVDDVSTGTREPDDVDHVSTGTREPDDVDHVSTGTREPGFVDHVSTGTREPDVVDHVSTGTREPGFVDHVSSVDRGKSDLAHPWSKIRGTEPDFVDLVKTVNGSYESDFVNPVSTVNGETEPDFVDLVNIDGSYESDFVNPVSTVNGGTEPDFTDLVNTVDGHDGCYKSAFVNPVNTVNGGTESDSVDQVYNIEGKLLSFVTKTDGANNSGSTDTVIAVDGPGRTGLDCVDHALIVCGNTPFDSMVTVADGTESNLLEPQSSVEASKETTEYNSSKYEISKANHQHTPDRGQEHSSSSCPCRLFGREHYPSKCDEHYPSKCDVRKEARVEPTCSLLMRESNEWDVHTPKGQKKSKAFTSNKITETKPSTKRKRNHSSDYSVRKWPKTAEMTEPGNCESTCTRLERGFLETMETSTITDLKKSGHPADKSIDLAKSTDLENVKPEKFARVCKVSSRINSTPGRSKDVSPKFSVIPISQNSGKKPRSRNFIDMLTKLLD